MPSNRVFKHIIFDLGGVILNINPALAKAGFEKLGIPNIEECYSKLKHNSVFKRLETGSIDEHTFYQTIKSYTKKPVTDEAIADAWNAMLLDIPLHRVHALKQLAKKFNLFLLSNTNSIHASKFERELKEKEGIKLHSLFQKVYYSHEIGVRKPDPEAFLHVLKEQNLKAAETLFIDDWEENIHTARSLGLQASWLQEGDEFMEVIKVTDKVTK